MSESAEQLTSSLASTINELPELQEKKRLIDAHMNIATELLRHIKARGLDSLYSIEESLIEGRSLGKEDKATLAALCAAQPGAAALTRVSAAAQYQACMPPSEMPVTPTREVSMSGRWSTR